MTLVLTPISVEVCRANQLFHWEIRAICPFPSLGDFNVRVRAITSEQPFMSDNQGKLLEMHSKAGTEFRVKLDFWAEGTIIKEDDKSWAALPLSPMSLSTSLLLQSSNLSVLLLKPNQSLVRFKFSREKPETMIVNSLDSVDSMHQKAFKAGVKEA